MFDLINIFDVFIPQLLQYPNAKDPLNTDAALTYIKDQQEYEKKVKYIFRRQLYHDYNVIDSGGKIKVL